jgi:hypothetical protein
LTTIPGSISHASTPGLNAFTFNGRVGGKKLSDGDYVITATPSSTSGVDHLPPSSCISSGKSLCGTQRMIIHPADHAKARNERQARPLATPTSRAEASAASEQVRRLRHRRTAIVRVDVLAPAA